MENVKLCQSCGMSLSEDELFGKHADGSRHEEYCCYCFPNGAFSNPDETMEEMITACVPYLVEAGDAPEADSAKAMLEEFLPTLKRWAKV